MQRVVHSIALPREESGLCKLFQEFKCGRNVTVLKPDGVVFRLLYLLLNDSSEKMVGGDP